jgi:hypothetical protein
MPPHVIPAKSFTTAELVKRESSNVAFQPTSLLIHNARRDARVRRQLQGCTVGEQGLYARKVFLGDFFAPAKKLPARKSGSSFFSDQEKALDSSLRWNDRQKAKQEEEGGSPASYIPAPESFTTVAAFRPWRDLQTIVAGEPTGPP